MGRTEKRELISRLTVLLLHLLKWRHQSGKRGPSWEASIAKPARRYHRSPRRQSEPRTSPAAGVGFGLSKGLPGGGCRDRAAGRVLPRDLSLDDRAGPGWRVLAGVTLNARRAWSDGIGGCASLAAASASLGPFQDGIDPRLPARTRRSKALNHVAIEPQGHGYFRLRFGGRPLRLMRPTINSERSGAKSGSAAMPRAILASSLRVGRTSFCLIEGGLPTVGLASRNDATISVPLDINNNMQPGAERPSR